MIYWWLLQISAALKDANFHPRLQSLLSNHQVCSINIYRYCLQKDKRNTLYASKQDKCKAALEYTTLLEYIEISICDCYQLKLCQSISFFHDFLKFVAKFLEMDDFSHSQGQTVLNNSPTANKARDFLARLMTSDYAVPWYGLIPWIGPMDTLSRERSNVTLSICFHQKTSEYFNGEREETWSAPGIEE